VIDWKGVIKQDPDIFLKVKLIYKALRSKIESEAVLSYRVIVVAHYLYKLFIIIIYQSIRDF